MKSEYQELYFATLEKLFQGDVENYYEKSFIAEHMIVNTKIMIELIENIESNQQLKGKYFHEKIMYSIDFKNIKGSGFSEYEAYENYVMKYNSNKYIMRKLRSLRKGSKYYGMSPTDEDYLRLQKILTLSHLK